MADTQAHQNQQFIETRDRGTLRRLDEGELSASAAEIPGASAAYTVHGQGAQRSRSAIANEREVDAAANRVVGLATFLLLVVAVAVALLLFS